MIKMELSVRVDNSTRDD